MNDDEVGSALGARPTAGSKLIVLFITSQDVNGTEIDQEYWLDAALKELARLFGGATAFPPSTGAWADTDGSLMLEDTIVIFCLADPARVTVSSMKELGAFLRRFGREANQGEVGVVIGNKYHPIVDY
jgi:hypothetical protein